MAPTLLIPLHRTIARLWAALLFYTALPLGSLTWITPQFEGIACFAPLVGLGLGGILAIVDSGLGLLHLDVLGRSTLIIVLHLGLTGGLHLDGAMDTADGLGVMDKQRCLEVMGDSRTGAFGVMAALVILLLKVTSLTTCTQYRSILLLLMPTWGRLAQTQAIAHYPYLKPQGKGAFHKQQWHHPQHAILAWATVLIPHLILSLSPAMPMSINGSLYLLGLLGTIVIPHWFNQQLDGHTGDTYGATVEWMETLWLLGAMILLASPGHLKTTLSAIGSL